MMIRCCNKPTLRSTMRLMAFFRSIYYFFSRYTDPSERRVGKFFQRVSEQTSPHRLEKSLLTLLQQDTAVINLWTEYRYKGYNYLTKSKRKELYQNLTAIQADFTAFAATQTIDVKVEIARIAELGVDTAKLRSYPDQLRHIILIQRYLSPKRGLYVYRASSSFGRLLRNPATEKLEGDCNQIVTLYLSLYASKYTVSDLKLTLYPGHVALHFEGVDIETTNGTFCRYQKEGQRTAPTQEIVSVNLLDTTDTNFDKTSVHPEIFLESARLAYVVSSNRQLVKKNLEIAYRNTVSHLMKSAQYKKAFAYAKLSKDQELIAISSHNGALYCMRQHDFRQARDFAAYSLKKAELLHMIDHNEAAWLYNAKRYQEAIKLFERLGERQWVANCYKALYHQEQQRLGSMKTVDDVKANAGTIRTMERHAKASGDSQLIQHVQSLIRHL